MWKPYPVPEGQSNNVFGISLLICFICFCLILGGLTAIFNRNSESTTSDWSPNDQPKNPKPNRADDPSCFGKYIYMHRVPDSFNLDIINNCSSIFELPGRDMCPALMNGGFGPRSQEFGASRSWFATDQFTLEVIFHNRMKQYKCLTYDSSLASAFYVPYYAGLDVGRYLRSRNATLTDEASLRLASWMRERSEWQSWLGKDHFLVAGRIISDFMRDSNPGTENDTAWGSDLMLLPEFKYMNVLTIETCPWSNTGIAIPYPTFYHPSSEDEVRQWQVKVKAQERPYLYSFVSTRPNNGDSTIRGRIISQCIASGEKCRFLKCANSEKCQDPANVMMVMMRARFCLQPSEESQTRRYTFDSIVGGCIPVFFNPSSAYTQYTTHLPSNQSSYSVYIPRIEVRYGKADIEKILLGIPENVVQEMQDEVISLIPKVIYVDPVYGSMDTFDDAFDLAIKEVLSRVNYLRKNTE